MAKETQKQAREVIINNLFKKLNEAESKSHVFGAENGLKHISFTTKHCSGDELVINKLFIDENGWIRISGQTLEYVFADVTLFSDAISTEDLEKILNEIDNSANNNI